MAMVFLAGAVFFTGCEKEENIPVYSSTDIQTANGPSQYNYYELLDEENGVYLNLRDMSQVQLALQRIDTVGTAIRRTDVGPAPIYVCDEGDGNTCGHAKEEIDGHVYYGHWYLFDGHITYLMDMVPAE